MPDTDAQNGTSTASSDETPPETPEETPEAAEQQEGPESPAEDDTETPDDEGRTFSYDYVKQLREESKGYRTDLRTAEALVSDMRQALWDTKLTALGRLADPSDLPLPDNVDPADDEAVNSAVSDLLERKPHLAARRARGNIGQHDETDEQHDSFSILGTMQQHA
jgi:hypothetical protein